MFAADTIFHFYCGGILWAYAKKPEKRYSTLIAASLNLGDEFKDDDGYEGIGGKEIV